MLKTIAKCCAIISIFCAINDSSATDIYTKMMPDAKSVSTLEYHLKPIFQEIIQEVNKKAKGKLIYDSSNWHMTIQPIEAPDYLKMTELRDWSTEDARNFNIKNLPRRLKQITDTLSNIEFKINGIAPFGGRNKFIVLTLEPILDHIENKSLKKKIRKRILENRPHISLSRFDPNVPIAKHDMFVFFHKALDAIENNDITIKFNRAVAEAEKGSPIQMYSVSQPIEVAAY